MIIWVLKHLSTWLLTFIYSYISPQELEIFPPKPSQPNSTDAGMDPENPSAPSGEPVVSSVWADELSDEEDDGCSVVVKDQREADPEVVGAAAQDPEADHDHRKDGNDQPVEEIRVPPTAAAVNDIHVDVDGANDDEDVKSSAESDLWGIDLTSNLVLIYFFVTDAFCNHLPENVF